MEVRNRSRAFRGKEDAMTDRMKRCIVCGVADPGEDTICPLCKALIRGEAVERHREIKKESDRVLHKEGTDIIRTRTPRKAA